MLEITRQGKVGEAGRKIAIDLDLPGDLSGRTLVRMEYTAESERVSVWFKDSEAKAEFTLDEFSLVAQSFGPALKAIEEERRATSLPESGSVWLHRESQARIVIEELIDNGKRVLYRFANEQRKWSMELGELRKEYRAKV
jgi:hypothetical protein